MGFCWVIFRIWGNLGLIYRVWCLGGLHLRFGNFRVIFRVCGNLRDFLRLGVFLGYFYSLEKLGFF